MHQIAWYNQNSTDYPAAVFPGPAAQLRTFLLCGRSAGNCKNFDLPSALPGGQTHGAGSVKHGSGNTSSPEPGVGFGGQTGTGLHPVAVMSRNGRIPAYCT